MTKKDHAYRIVVKLTETEHEIVEQMIESAMYSSATEFARVAIKHKLEETEPITIRHLSKEDIEGLVDTYLTEHPGPHFASEIASKLALDFRSTLDTIARMIEAGKIRKSRGKAV